MNTQIRYLDLLEDDLMHAAAREAEREKALALGGGGKPPRRLPRRGGGGGGNHGRTWIGIAAATVAILVLAGSIGFLTQASRENQLAQSAPSFDSAGDEAGSATKAPEPGVAPAPGDTEAGGGLTPELTGQASAAYLALRNDELQSLSRDRYGLTWSALSDAQKAVVQQAAGITGSISAPQGPLGDLSKIIRDGRIEVVVGNGEFERKLATVTRIANSNGGFVLTSSTRDQKSGTLTLRIPDNRFDVAMEQLRRLGEVKADEVTGQDVTAEFVDNRARLDILLGRRALLRRLQNDATTSSEILRLAGLIERTQLEIERIQGSLNFIRDEVAEATIKVELREKDAPVAEQQQQENVDQPSLGNSVELGVQGFMRVVGAVVVGLGYLIPVGAIAVVIWAVVMVVRRRSRVAS